MIVTVFDIAVLILLGALGVLGIMRGFVQEALSLLAFAGATLAIGFLHDDVTPYLTGYLDNAYGASLLSYALIFIIAYFILRFIAGRVGEGVRGSVLGPIDRVLGMGFGMVKGLIIATLIFLLINLSYQFIYATPTLPDEIAKARTYPLLNASSKALIDYIDERRAGDEDIADPAQ
jgi:membrane protein required for colicin V production